MKSQEQQLVQDVANMFKQHSSVILKTWLQMLGESKMALSSVERGYFERGFFRLISDFTDFLPQSDFDSYYAGNAVIAKEIASNNISYSKFVQAFHLFEESYASLLLAEFATEDMLMYFMALDSVHHDTIAIVSEAYFEIEDATVFALAKLVELRDPYTLQHLELTREYSIVLAKSLGMDSTFIESLSRAGMFHDIGKVAIADHILLKPGALSAEERSNMQRHVTIGCKVIEDIIGDRKVVTGHLLMARDITLYHHERYDGGGYPEKLSAEEIPFSARIFALADSYDAMTSARIYSEPISHEEAVQRIRDDSGHHFDPVVVEAFLEVHEQFEPIKKRLK